VAANIIARNYAETLLALAQRQGGGPVVEQYLAAIEEAAEAMRTEPRVRQFLETPRLDAGAKKAALRAAFAGRVPEPFLRFLLVVVDKRRQGQIPQIAAAYRELVDELAGRVRVEVQLAHQPDAAMEEEIRRSLERKLGKTVVPHFTVDPALLGGIVVRLGDEILDGSVRRRAQDLRRRLASARMPAPAAV
jgi:F-type H+-transporting ATPase subunit delta